MPNGSDRPPSGHSRPGEGADDIGGVRPAYVVEAAEAQDVPGTLRWAEARHLSVVPRGGGTKIGWGNPPARADVVLSLARLNRVLEHAWADLTVTVEAGCTIAALQETLRAHGQRVAIDPLWPERATVGGVLSTNDTGALRLRFGALRDLIIGVTIALPDGTVAASGGKVVKNVAGYDLPKLVTGAFGTLGVITQAVFRLHPLPQASTTLTAQVESFREAHHVTSAIQDSRLAHTSLQIRAASDSTPAVDVRFEGSEAGNRAQIAQLPGLTAREWTTAEFDDRSVWSARQNLWMNAGDVLKVSVLPTDLALALDVVAGAAGDTAWRSVLYGNGLFWLQIDSCASRAVLVDALRTFAERRGGSAVILRPGPSDDPVDTWGRAGSAQGLMTTVKEQFDPHLTLNPGRFVGGI